MADLLAADLLDERGWVQLDRLLESESSPLADRAAARLGRLAAMKAVAARGEVATERNWADVPLVDLPAPLARAVVEAHDRTTGPKPTPVRRERQKVCEWCETTFTARRSDARWCSSTCRNRGSRWGQTVSVASPAPVTTGTRKRRTNPQVRGHENGPISGGASQSASGAEPPR